MAPKKRFQVTPSRWSLGRADWANSTLVKEDADLSATLIRHRLFDEYRIGLVPVTLGEGGPPFKRDDGAMQGVRIDVRTKRRTLVKS